MKTQYIGIEVGGWQSTSSSDAVAMLTEEGGRHTWSILSRKENGVKIRNAIHPEKFDSSLARIQAGRNVQTFIGIGAALGWPVDFVSLVNKRLPKQLPVITDYFTDNTILFRECERFVNRVANRTSRAPVGPLSAVATLFGNPTKAQVIGAMLKEKFRTYNPPFDEWNIKVFRRAPAVVVEVDPAISLLSARLKSQQKAAIKAINNDLRGRKSLLTIDEADAVCAALTVRDLHKSVSLGADSKGIRYFFPGDNTVPRAATKAITKQLNLNRIETEGWIFFPSDISKIL